MPECFDQWLAPVADGCCMGGFTFSWLPWTSLSEPLRETTLSLSLSLSLCLSPSPPSFLPPFLFQSSCSSKTSSQTSQSIGMEVSSPKPLQEINLKSQSVFPKFPPLLDQRDTECENIGHYKLIIVQCLWWCLALLLFYRLALWDAPTKWIRKYIFIFIYFCCVYTCVGVRVVCCALFINQGICKQHYAADARSRCLLFGVQNVDHRVVSTLFRACRGRCAWGPTLTRRLSHHVRVSWVTGARQKPGGQWRPGPGHEGISVTASGFAMLNYRVG